MTLQELAIIATWEDAAACAVSTVAGFFRKWKGRNYDENEALAEAGFLFMKAYLSFDGRGDFTGWLKAVTVRGVLEGNRDRRRRLRTRPEGSEDGLESVPCRPELDYEGLVVRLSDLSEDGLAAVAAALEMSKPGMTPRQAEKMTRAALRMAGWSRLRTEIAFKEVRRCLEGRE